MFIANSHLKMMRSFVSAPEVHVAALKNPAMLGGAFINHPASKAAEIKELMDWTTDTCASMLELADAIKTLDTMVQAQANGTSLEPLYQEVPAPLRGYVELVYDINNHPAVRFIEGLLYRSRFYQPDLQSIALFAGSGERPFAFNTPKLPGRTNVAGSETLRVNRTRRALQNQIQAAPVRRDQGNAWGERQGRAPTLIVLHHRGGTGRHSL